MAFSKHEKPNKGNTDIWLTPLHLINALGEFDLDPCGELNHNTAKYIFNDKGLEKEWFGRVWLNPPYSEVEKWLNKLEKHGNGIALVFARLDTKWAQKIIPKSSSVFFPKGRLKFLNYEKKIIGSAGAPSMFLSFGEIPNWNNLGEGLIWLINGGL